MNRNLFFVFAAIWAQPAIAAEFFSCPDEGWGTLHLPFLAADGQSILGVDPENKWSDINFCYSYENVKSKCTVSGKTVHIDRDDGLTRVVMTFDARTGVRHSQYMLSNNRVRDDLTTTCTRIAPSALPAGVAERFQRVAAKH